MSLTGWPKRNFVTRHVEEENRRQAHQAKLAAQVIAAPEPMKAKAHAKKA
jgi:hypothetical protein